MEPTFTSTKDLFSFAELHKLNPEELASGVDCLLERNARTALQPAKVIEFTIVPVERDYSGNGKYMNRDSFAMVQIDGDEILKRWPLTMIYFKK